MGVFDQIGNALTGKTPGTTSGMDAALQTHVDKLHPVNSGAGVQQRNSAPVATKYRKDGSLVLMGDADYGK